MKKVNVLISALVAVNLVGANSFARYGHHEEHYHHGNSDAATGIFAGLAASLAVMFSIEVSKTAEAEQVIQTVKAAEAEASTITANVADEQTSATFQTAKAYIQTYTQTQVSNLEAAKVIYALNDQYRSEAIGE